MESKRTTVEFKAAGDDGADIGKVSALFATLNVIDNDRDVTIPGAFKNGEIVRIASYGHKMSELPVGDGVIFSDQSRATMNGEFYVETSHGMDTYKTVKRQSEKGLQEWSYEFDVLDSEYGTWNGEPVRFLKSMKVHGVTPVYLGAGIGTQTLDIKSYAEHGEQLAKDVDAYIQRIKTRISIRAKEGRTLSAANRNRLSALVEQLTSAQTAINELLVSTAPNDDGKADVNIEALLADFLAVEAKLSGALIVN